MSTIYFISDVHLNAHSPQVEAGKLQRLIPFLDHVLTSSKCLYIVGDLYNFWFEYHHVIPRVNLKLLAKLNQLVEQGVAVHYLTGNHDMWQNTYLSDEIGVTLYHRPIQVKHNGLQLFIAHGDDLAKNDRKLVWLRRIFENRLNIMLYRWIHPDIGIPLAHWVTSRSALQGDNKYDADYREFAIKKLQDGTDAVILGHTHKPIFQLIDDKFYINLGDWISKFTYLEMTGKQFHLKTWPAC
jgi:UDP-2,3-diacylglucosamine hydrolase